MRVFAFLASIIFKRESFLSTCIGISVFNSPLKRPAYATAEGGVKGVCKFAVGPMSRSGVLA